MSMKTFLTALRQDLFALRWLLPLWILVLVMLRFTPEPISAYGPDTPDNFRPILAVGAVLVWFLSLGQILFNHPVTDNRSAWRTRPLSAGWLAVEKWLLIGALLLAVPLLFHPFSPGPPSAAAFKSPTDFARIVGATLVELVFLGSLCRTSRAFLITVPLVFVAGSFSLTLWASFVAPDHPIRISPAGALANEIVLLVGLILLVIHQYQRPHRGRTIGGFIALLVTTGVITWLNPHASQSVPRLSPGSTQATVIPNADADLSSPSVTVTLADLDPQSAWSVFYAAPENAKRIANPFPDRSRLIANPALLKQLGLSSYHATDALNPRFDLPLSATPPANQRFHFQLQRLELRPLIDVPLRAGAQAATAAGIHLDLTQIDPTSHQTRVVLRVPAEAWSRLRHGVHRDPVPQWVLIDDTARVVHVLGRPHITAVTADSTELKIPLPDVAFANPDLRLLCFEVSRTGTLTLFSALAATPNSPPAP